ncbi:kinase domain-containing protein [Scheffersomyces coipomensis]|uniref:kinase domain-containing protein n=1 Tax=Scheffersomyces coipomensis TaxID=1788519 RepID=UPI00315D091B
MVESKSKKTFTKLGKLFGVSSSNVQVNQQSDHIKHNHPQSPSSHEGLSSPSLLSSPSPPISNLIIHDNVKTITSNDQKSTNKPESTFDDDKILSQENDDLLLPLPDHTINNNNNTHTVSTANTTTSSSPKLSDSRSNTPTNLHPVSSTTTSPLSLVSSKDFNHPHKPSTATTSNENVDHSNGIHKIQQPQPYHSLSPSNLSKLNGGGGNTSSANSKNSVSRSSSTNLPRKHANTVSAHTNNTNGHHGPNGRSNSVSRASSTKVQSGHGITSAHPSNISMTNLTTPISSPTPSSMGGTVQAPRFRILENGNHEHNLKSAKRQEKLSNMLKDLLGAKKLRDEAKSAVPGNLQNLVQLHQQQQGIVANNHNNKDKPPTLLNSLVTHIKNNTNPYDGTPNQQTNKDLRTDGEININSPLSIVNLKTSPEGEKPTIPSVTPHAQPTDGRSFVEKYGRCQEVIGRGAFGVVRVSHKKVLTKTSSNDTIVSKNNNNMAINEEGDYEILYAVKEFKRKSNESDKKYTHRLTAEFCISSCLKNINIIDTLDLLKDAKGDYCEVMEFCSGGDLYTLIIASGKLEYAEADCFFKQLIRGVNYIHDMGVSHRDLKPENLLLTQNGILKITDFGNSECFKMAWEDDIQLSEGICGSSPYIAPEEFTQYNFDPRGVDIWSCGVIYMAMRTGRQLWKLADPKKDEFFEEYLLKRKDLTGYEPIENLKRARCRNVIYSILDPKPERRITGKQILNSEWGREIKVCEAGEGH